MKISRRLLYFIAFVGLAALAAVALSRVGNPSMASQLIWAVVAASLAGAPGLVHRRAWPAAFLLLPLGAYLVARAQVPLPSSVHGVGGQVSYYLDQLRSGSHTYATHKFPLDLGGAADLKLLLSLSMYAATGLAAFVALSFRKPLPAIVITLIPLGFGLTVDSSTRVIWLPLAFVVLAGCMLMLSRSLLREHWKFADAVTGGATAVIATLLALSLLGATSVSASKPWGNWRAWGPLTDDASRIRFDWMANYPSLLDPQTNAPVMRVTSPVASYWRANALDYFTGSAWISGWSYTSPLVAVSIPGAVRYDIPAGDPTASGKAVTEVFDVRSMYTDFFFTGGTPTTLVTDQQAPVFANDALALRLPQPLGPQLHYTLTAVVPQLKPADLVGKGRDYPSDVFKRYASLPFPSLAELTSFDPRAEWQTTMSDSPADREWLGLYALNQQIVGGATDPYEIALRIEQYLRSNDRYSLAPPKTDYESPYAAFLFATKTGYCQHFAGAMAALLRFNGIPARVDVGFTTGRRLSDGTYQVSRNDAHAWVEAYFPQAGWATFDPTPGRALPGAGTSSTSAGFVNPFTATGTTSAAAPTQKPASRPRNPASGRADQIPVGSGVPSRSASWLLWILVPVGALLIWPLGRAVVRRASLRRGSVEKRLGTSLRMVFAELRDYGVDMPPSRTLPETAHFLEDYLGLKATPLVNRIEAVLFGGRTAGAQDVADVIAFRRELRRRLRARKGLGRALLAIYGLPVAAR